MATLALTNMRRHRIGQNHFVLADVPALSGVGTWDDAQVGITDLLYVDVQYNNAATEPKIQVNMNAAGTATVGMFRIKGTIGATGVLGQVCSCCCSLFLFLCLY